MKGNDTMKKKKWNKPAIISLSAKDLANHIKVAANSGGVCIYSNYR